MELLPTPFPQTEHGEEVSIDTVFLPVQNVGLFKFTFKSFSVIAFFYCTYLFSTSFQLSLKPQE